MDVGAKVYGPSTILNGAGKQLVMTVAAVDVAPGESAKIKAAQGLDVHYINCSYTLNDTEHVETFREDSLTPAS